MRSGGESSTPCHVQMQEVPTVRRIEVLNEMFQVVMLCCGSSREGRGLGDQVWTIDSQQHNVLFLHGKN